MIFCDDELASSLKRRYSKMHPLVLQRSIERALSLSELFEILESVPKAPFSWSEESRSWVKDSDLMAKKQLKKIRSQRK